jgi:BirA family biotin operon repressor/biotin-[acetyl-CoA-carboxylase] ligase
MSAASAIDLPRLIDGTFVAGGEQHEAVSSTNDLGRELPRNVVLPYLILAAEQTAGRGRGANAWWTGRGSLAMSLVIEPGQHGIRPQHAALVSLACAGAVVQAVQQSTKGISVGLHWPNDVFANGRKLSGILIEALPGGRMILGIGVNTNNSLADAPGELRRTATTLRDLAGHPCDHTSFLVDLLSNLEQAFLELRDRPAALAQQADRLCLQHGQELTVLSGQETIVGKCHGIADDGALVLATIAGMKRVYSGALVKKAVPS